MLFAKTCKSVSQKIFRDPARGLDIAASATIDPKEASVAGTDVSAEDVEAIWQDAEALHRSGMHPMVSVSLRRKGKQILHRSIGFSGGLDEGQPVSAALDTPVCLFSASKVISAVLVHKLAEDGLLDLLNPVSHYIPAFAQGGKARITIYQLLAHRAGVPGLAADTPTEVLFDSEEALRRICAEQALCEDGRVVAYHAITGGFVLAELIRVCTGKDVNSYLDEVIRKPMGMRYFRYGLDPKDHAAAAQNYVSGLPNVGPVGNHLEKVLGADVDSVVRLSNTEAFLNAQIPSGNLYATAEEASRFFEMLRQQGEWRGKQILSPLTVNRLTREAARPQFDRSLIIPMRYSAGCMLGGRYVGVYGRHTPFAFGHLGFSNILCWADPQRDLSVAVLNTGKPVVGNHIVSLLKLVDGISQRCGPCENMQALNSKMPRFSLKTR